MFLPSKEWGFNFRYCKGWKKQKQRRQQVILETETIFGFVTIKLKNHKPVEFNLNDPVIKSCSKKYVGLLIETIIESINDYPRQKRVAAYAVWFIDL